MEYERPYIEIVEADLVLLSMSGPGATDIGSPSVEEAKEYSVWDEEEILYNINNKEESYEDWI